MALILLFGCQNLRIALDDELPDLFVQAVKQLSDRILRGLKLLELQALRVFEVLELGALGLKLGLLGLKARLCGLELFTELLKPRLHRFDVCDHGLVGLAHLVEVIDVGSKLFETLGREQKLQETKRAGLIGARHTLAELLLLGFHLGLLGIDHGLGIRDLLGLGLDFRLGIRDLVVDRIDLVHRIADFGRQRLSLLAQLFQASLGRSGLLLSVRKRVERLLRSGKLNRLGRFGRAQQKRARPDQHGERLTASHRARSDKALRAIFEMLARHANLLSTFA